MGYESAQAELMQPTVEQLPVLLARPAQIMPGELPRVLEAERIEYCLSSGRAGSIVRAFRSAQWSRSGRS